MKHFVDKLYKMYTLQKKSSTSNPPKSQDVKVHEIVETITMKNDKQAEVQESVHKAAHKENLLCLFDQYSDLMSSTSDWLAKDIDIIINDGSPEEISVE